MLIQTFKPFCRRVAPGLTSVVWNCLQCASLTYCAATSRHLGIWELWEKEDFLQNNDLHFTLFFTLSHCTASDDSVYLHGLKLEQSICQSSPMKTETLELKWAYAVAACNYTLVSLFCQLLLLLGHSLLSLWTEIFHFKFTFLGVQITGCYVSLLVGFPCVIRQYGRSDPSHQHLWNILSTHFTYCKSLWYQTALTF